jgi:CheY-like chemotaxis protein
LEELLNELNAKPKKVNLSTLRTVAQAVDFLEVLLEHAGPSCDPIIASPLILVLDDDSISRETICTALEKVDLRAVSLGDSGVALKLLEENRFDLVFLDVEMPGLKGYEVCQKLRATTANAKTPVVFVTALTDFETRAQSALSGGTDVIAKPIVLIELAVKAMIHLLRAQLGAAPGV